MTKKTEYITRKEFESFEDNLKGWRNFLIISLIIVFVCFLIFLHGISNIEKELKNKADRICWEEEIVEEINISNMYVYGEYPINANIDCNIRMETIEIGDSIAIFNTDENINGKCYIQYFKEVCEIR